MFIFKFSRQCQITFRVLIQGYDSITTSHDLYYTDYKIQMIRNTTYSILYILLKLWYIYTMECYSAIKKNTFESVLMKWMKLEPIIQSEVSQKEKHQYSILTHIYGI